MKPSSACVPAALCPRRRPRAVHCSRREGGGRGEARRVLLPRRGRADPGARAGRRAGGRHARPRARGGRRKRKGGAARARARRDEVQVRARARGVARAAFWRVVGPVWLFGGTAGVGRWAMGRRAWALGVSAWGGWLGRRAAANLPRTMRCQPCLWRDATHIGLQIHLGARYGRHEGGPDEVSLVVSRVREQTVYTGRPFRSELRANPRRGFQDNHSN